MPPILGQDAAAPAPEPPAESVDPAAQVGSAILHGRLHPFTLVVALFKAVRNFLIPAVVVLFTGSESTLGVILIAFLGMSLLQALVRFVTFSYRIEGGELITKEGILERRERNIPLTRVQDLRVEQGVIHRILGVVDLQVETAGGSGAEASLSVLSRREAQRLRDAVFEQAERSVVSETGEADEQQLIHAVSLKNLVLAGMTSNHLASGLVILAAGFQFLDEFVPEKQYERIKQTFAGQVENWISQGSSMDWLAIAAVFVIVIVIGMVISVGGSLLLFHGFTLSRRGEDLYRTYGLLTRRSSSLPRRRIQLLKIEESWLRRLLGLATLRADSAGSRPADQERGKDGRDVLLPVVSSDRVEGILPRVLPDLELEPDRADWRDVSRCAIRRGTTKGAVVLLALAALGLGVERSVYGAWPVVFIPVVYLINVVSFKHLGYALTDRFFRTRRGWLSRTTHLVPVRNVQMVVLRQTPFDRRFRVNTLLVDTAGQAFTGGGPKIRNLDQPLAREVAWELARRASRTRFRW